MRPKFRETVIGRPNLAQVRCPDVRHPMLKSAAFGKGSLDFCLQIRTFGSVHHDRGLRAQSASDVRVPPPHQLVVNGEAAMGFASAFTLERFGGLARAEPP
jgi:hypothetical protein